MPARERRPPLSRRWRSGDSSRSPARERRSSEVGREDEADLGAPAPARLEAGDGAVVELDGLPPLRNDLEPAAHHVEPRLAAFKAAIERATGAPALLAGSGSSYALVFRDIAAAEDARARIAETLDGQVVVALTVDAGVRERR